MGVRKNHRVQELQASSLVDRSLLWDAYYTPSQGVAMSFHARNFKLIKIIRTEIQF